MGGIRRIIRLGTSTQSSAERRHCFAIATPTLRAPSTSCTGVWLPITMLQYYICLGIVLTVILVLGLGLGFGIILYFVIGT